MLKFLSAKAIFLIGALFGCLLVMQAASAATITFDNLSIVGPVGSYADFVEDGMRYSVGEEFAISNSVGATPSSLINTRRGTFPFVVRRVEGGLFTLDQFTIQPAVDFSESDEIFIRGFRRFGIPQFSETIVSSGTGGIATLTGPNARRPIDMLIVALSPFSPLNDVPAVLDNFVFTFVEVPEPSSLLIFALGCIALLVSGHARKASSGRNTSTIYAKPLKRCVEALSFVAGICVHAGRNQNMPDSARVRPDRSA